MNVPSAKKFWIWAAAIFFIAAGCTTIRQRPAAIDIELAKVKRILFLGDSITYDGRYVTDFEAWLVQRFPGRTIEIINAGLPSETVSGLTEEGHADGKFDRPYLPDRLVSVLEKTKPDLVFACYGMNCGIYKPFDETRFAKYREGISKLHGAVAKAGARIVHVTPPVYDASRGGSGAADYDDVLGRYSEWLVSKREDGWDVLDVHGPMREELDRRRALDPGFAFSSDGVHPGDAGHWFVARLFIGYCGDAKAAATNSVEEMAGTGAEALPLLRERMAVMRDAWLTHTGHNHPSVPKGLPLDEAMAKYRNLSERIAATTTIAP